MRGRPPLRLARKYPRGVTLRQVSRPAAGEAVGALVFFHGFSGLPAEHVAFLDKVDPERRFEGRLPQGPYEISEGRASWFRRGGTELPEHDLAPVAEWLDALPWRPEHTVLVGWSQGANVAHSLGFGAGRPRPAGVIALSGGFRRGVAMDLEPPLPPVAIAHGSADESVPVDDARAARDALERAGATVLYLETDVGHEIDEAVVPDLRAFLAKLP